MKNNTNDLWICLGRIVRPHGIKGALSMKLDNPNSESLRPGLVVRVEPKKGAASMQTVASFHAGRILVFEGVNDRNAAELFQHAQVFVKRSDFPSLKEDEIYLNDMIGFEVVDQNSQVLGKIEGFSDNTVQILLVVGLNNGLQGMIPFVSPLIKNVNQVSKVISVDIPPGLFESEKVDA